MYKYVHMIYICKSTPETETDRQRDTDAIGRQRKRERCDRETDRQTETGAIDTQTAATNRKIDCPPVPVQAVTETDAIDRGRCGRHAESATAERRDVFDGEATHRD